MFFLPFYKSIFKFTILTIAVGFVAHVGVAHRISNRSPKATFIGLPNVIVEALPSRLLVPFTTTFRKRFAEFTVCVISHRNLIVEDVAGTLTVADKYVADVGVAPLPATIQLLPPSKLYDSLNGPSAPDPNLPVSKETDSASDNSSGIDPLEMSTFSSPLINLIDFEIAMNNA
jgi:hypothetical protein